MKENIEVVLRDVKILKLKKRIIKDNSEEVYDVNGNYSLGWRVRS